MWDVKWNTQIGAEAVHVPLSWHVTCSSPTNRYPSSQENVRELPLIKLELLRLTLPLEGEGRAVHRISTSKITNIFVQATVINPKWTTQKQMITICDMKTGRSCVFIYHIYQKAIIWQTPKFESPDKLCFTHDIGK